MGFQIEDGTGSGSQVLVDDEHRLHTVAACSPNISVVSDQHGESYTWTATSVDLAAGATALWLSNESTTRKLYITKIYVWADVPTQFAIHVPAYVAPAGTLVTGVNLNRTSGNAADALAYANETNNVYAAANVITMLRNNEATADEFGQWVDFEGALILGYHDPLAIDLIADTAAFECHIRGFFHD